MKYTARMRAHEAALLYRLGYKTIARLLWARATELAELELKEV